MVQVNKANQQETYDMADLLNIISRLRAPGGCPWDREQTHRSIRNNVIEEAYEAADAIDRGHTADLCEELGDLLLQVVFHARIAADAGTFTFEQVVDGICKKLILRHPHVFGSVEVASSDEVMVNWETIKRQEKHQTTYTQSLQSVPRAFPALLRAQKVQKRAAKAGFDWPDAAGAWDKLFEESRELEQAVRQKEPAKICEELGDLLFTVVNLARFYGTDAEQALQGTTDKFINRFEQVEEKALQNDGGMDGVALSTLDRYWDEAKDSNSGPRSAEE